MFPKTITRLAVLAISSGVLAGTVPPCTPDQLTLHGITGGPQTAPYSHWEDVPGSGGKELQIFDKSDSTEPSNPPLLPV
ncbi:hypothetical protein AAF712_016173 [Marasmius tenuissimus]|uniref:Uncharacterized protein n=1 Tax=Marasmius tenuissimus TaxID=585030 RepID=A0ABR2Z7F0_9AGAR